MTTAIIANLEKMLGGPRDNALLHFSLGNEWLKAGNPARAADFFRVAVVRDAKFSAAWKLLGKALSESSDLQAALGAYTQGVEVAEERGDIQAAKEMRVFVRRLRKKLYGG